MEILIVLICGLSLVLLGFGSRKAYRLFENDWVDYDYYETPISIGPLRPPETPKTEPQAPVLPEPKETPMTPTKSNRERIYDTAYACLGKHMGLDKSVDKSVNCANALTHVMILSGIPGLPAKGIASTASLYGWLLRSTEFEKIANPEPGDIAIFPTGYGNGSVRGHAFIVGKKNPMSNNSKNGLFEAHWDSLKEAEDFYTKKGGIPRHCFRWID